jgi:hypothetical protein
MTGGSNQWCKLAALSSVFSLFSLFYFVTDDPTALWFLGFLFFLVFLAPPFRSVQRPT